METDGNLKQSQATLKSQVYTCEVCNVSTSHKNDYAKHCNTIKHKQSIGLLPMEIQEVPTKHHYQCLHCDRNFVTNSGLWRHKKNCKPKQNQDEVVNILKNQNQAFADIILKNNEDLKNMVIEICKTTLMQTTNNTNSHNTNTINNNNTNSNNTNNSNNSFNLNFFLNETCKDAINLSEFIRSIKCTFEDIERIGNMGYINGLADMIIRHLNDLGVERRPIHCTDAKRQTMYVKEDDKWDKEDHMMTRLVNLINDVQRLNLRKLAEWRDLHPSCLTSSSQYTSGYNKMSHELMGGDCININMAGKDSKIINKIAKFVTVEKK
jgi:hypothetical protein